MKLDMTRQVSDYNSARDRQQAGIAALISLARATAPPKMMPGLHDDLAQNSLGHNSSGQEDLDQTQATKKRPLYVLRDKLSLDRMVRNSLYLILSSGLQAAFGFAFWVITARLFSTAVVGIASSLISATTVISFIALLGLNSTFVRYLPTARDRNALITVGLILVAACGAVVGLIYVISTPFLAPRLSFILHRPVLTIGFALLSASAVVNLLTDSVFIASRKAGFNALIDGGIGGASKLIFVLLLSGSGAYGIFCASTGGMAAAGLASLVLMATVLHWRPTMRRSFEAIKPLLRFSGANYAANVLGLLPILVVPIIALDRLGASAAAYYFIDFQIATLLYSAAFAVEQNFTAEGSQINANWRTLRKRSSRVLIKLVLPPSLILIAVAHWILLIFGSNYSKYGTEPDNARSWSASNGWYELVPGRAPPRW